MANKSYHAYRIEWKSSGTNFSAKVFDYDEAIKHYNRLKLKCDEVKFFELKELVPPDTFNSRCFFEWCKTAGENDCILIQFDIGDCRGTRTFTRRHLNYISPIDEYQYRLSIGANPIIIEQKQIQI